MVPGKEPNTKPIVNASLFEKQNQLQVASLLLRLAKVSLVPTPLNDAPNDASLRGFLSFRNLSVLIFSMGIAIFELPGTCK
jgi:hypothetical protein